VADNPRIEELRRRIQKDPASIAFAQLAEEHRRAGQFDDAVRVCRAGLAQHPAYLSARITLGRALLEMGRYDEAASEFEYVLKAAPDNLTAVRELADIEQRRRTLAPQAPAPPAPVPPAPVQPAPAPQAPVPSPAAAPPAPSPAAAVPAAPAAALDPVLAELEAWLSVLTEERVARTAGV
jgi:tetratricopeptide (TPR) repeat protein